jgi:hypothetical protein
MINKIYQLIKKQFLKIFKTLPNNKYINNLIKKKLALNIKKYKIIKTQINI